jgi:DNA repair protein RadC
MSGRSVDMAAPDMPEKKQDEHYAGHRKRLRRRFLDSRTEGFPDYELLELLLFAAHPRRDVKPVAKDLLKRFGGSLSAVVCAKAEQAADVPGMNEAALAAFKAVREIASRMLKEETSQGSVLDGWKALVDYCRLTMGFETTEHFRVLYLNTKRRLIRDELQEAGTIDHTPVYTREIVKKALGLDAKSVVLVHNHPSGDVSPSKADVSATHRINVALQTVNVELLDHVIVSKATHFSFRASGYL